MCSTMGRKLSSSDMDAAMARLDADGSGVLSFEEFLVWWDVGLSVESLLRLASAAATAPLAGGRAAKQANAERKAKRKQSLIEAFAVGGEESVEERKDRPGRESTRKSRGAGPSGAPAPPRSKLAGKAPVASEKGSMPQHVLLPQPNADGSAGKPSAAAAPALGALEA